MFFRVLCASVSLAALLWAPARADDVTDQVNEAMTAYARKDVAIAISGLEAALNLLRQSRADSYGKLLPAAPSGWTADEPEAISGAAMIGMGTGASRKYHKGDDTITISILTDSPMMQAIAAFSSSGLAAAAGVRTMIVNGRRAMYMKDDNAFTSIVAERVLVRVEGRGNTPEAILKQFFQAIDFAAIERMAK